MTGRLSIDNRHLTIDNKPMLLTINGESKDLPVTTLASLVEHLGLKSDRLAIELNMDIAPRSTWDATELKDGDKLEIVHFVGGGRV